MRAMTLLTLIAILTAGLGAQKPTPTPLMDSRGIPLPFGVQPYYKPDVPQGSGPYKAIMSAENGLSAHVAYFPANLSAAGESEDAGGGLGQRLVPLCRKSLPAIPD